tara:strand:+ start:1759 stop:2226 length:468 start_codon:yes stop_codon:yes gene_type:complete
MALTKEARYHSLYMDIANRVGQMSHARRKQVGAVIVKDGRIISMGWNGMPTGWDNNCEKVISEPFLPETEHLETRDEVLHAESNAIAKLAKSNESGDGSVIYISCAPCIDCAKLILQTGISEVFYGELYKNNYGINFLETSNIPVHNLGAEICPK